MGLHDAEEQLEACQEQGLQDEREIGRLERLIDAVATEAFKPTGDLIAPARLLRIRELLQAERA